MKGLKGSENNIRLHVKLATIIPYLQRFTTWLYSLPFKRWNLCFYPLNLGLVMWLSMTNGTSEKVIEQGLEKHLHTGICPLLLLLEFWNHQMMIFPVSLHREETLPPLNGSKTCQPKKHMSKAILYHLAPAKAPADHRDQQSSRQTTRIPTMNY